MSQFFPEAEAFGQSLGDIGARLAGLFDTVSAQLLSLETLWQGLAFIGAAGLAYLLSRRPVKHLDARRDARPGPDMLYRFYNSAARVVWPVMAVLLLWMLTVAFTALGLQDYGLRVAASLITAWIIVHVVTVNLRPGFWSTAIAYVAWTLAALYILRLLEPLLGGLDSIVFNVGGAEFSLLRLITSLAVAALALFAGRVAGDVAQSTLTSSRTLPPAISGMLGQILKIALMVIAIIVALHTLGVNLTALTIFSGALGVGIGFGLQSIFSNFISGLIILFEKSLKVGDFVELPNGVRGTVREVNIRSTLVTTNDNVDVLVPNEQFIKSEVINWTLRDNKRRIRVPFGVAYGSDKELVRKAALEAAAEVKWTHDDGAGAVPQVWLVKFGDSSLDFELVVWLVPEAVPRPAKVIADYNWAIHSALERHGLEIPFPQRDLHVRSPDSLRVRIEREGGD